MVSYEASIVQKIARLLLNEQKVVKEIKLNLKVLGSQIV
jgi:hypothetical protein